MPICHIHYRRIMPSWLSQNPINLARCLKTQYYCGLYLNIPITSSMLQARTEAAAVTAECVPHWRSA